eukprot:CAMPEP_0195048948 /NCGR_PEP_ID=MMETSP0347-20130606/51794_1 /TAXON_ID=2932 /ORGANISM="Alexandrium fundyense, Strain CCMP1719" /LENGTH=31 /DNA_ID= /DNA_START= /DNA_END= /DNA_ORIENTATION=
MPRPSSWKTRETTGGGAGTTPEPMPVTTNRW